MHKKIITCLIFTLFALYASASWADRYIEDATPLEQEGLIKWVNKHCSENHQSWESLTSDGYIKCASRGNSPVFFWQLKGAKGIVHKPSILGFTEDTIKPALFVIFIILYLIFGKKLSWKGIGFFFIFVMAYYLIGTIPEVNSSKETNRIRPIRSAARENYLRDIKHHVNNGYNPNAILNNGKTLLDIVAENGFIETTNFVSQFSPEINDKYQGKTKLLTAVKTQNINIVKKALGYSESKILQTEERRRRNVFEIATEYEDLSILKLLYNNLSQFSNVETHLNYGVFTHALRNDNIAAAKYVYHNYLYEEDKDIILRYVVGNGSVNALKDFLAIINNDLSTLKAHKVSVFEASLRNPNTEVFKYLYSNNVFGNLSKSQINEMVESQFRSNINHTERIDSAIFLFLKGYNINKEIHDNDKCNMVCYSVKLNNSKILNELLEAGVDSKKKDRYGNTPLMYAHEGGNPKIIRLLNNQQQ